MPDNSRDEMGELAGAWLPGDGEPEEHPYDELLEHVAPSHGVIKARLERARKAHREAEANPDKGAMHLGLEPTPDMGGVTMPADPRNLTGPFVPVPPDEVQPPMTGGRKMRVQSFAESQAEIAEGRAEIARQKAQDAREFAQREVELLEEEAALADHEAREARRNAEPGGS